MARCFATKPFVYQDIFDHATPDTTKYAALPAPLFPGTARSLPITSPPLRSTARRSSRSPPRASRMRLPAPLIRSLMAETGMKEIAHYLRASHLQFLANILEDPEASDNDKFVATNLLKNSCVAAEGKLPTCQV